MKQITLFLIALAAAICSSDAASSNSVWAAISAGKPIFVAGKDEVEITFAAVNDTKLPVRYALIRDEGVLVINGQELRDSSFIFGNGPHSSEEFLQPGKTCLFGYRLTDHFRKPGDYEVIWKGRGFQTKPIAFRVVEAQ